MEREKARSRRTTVLEVKGKALQYVLVPGIYHGDTQMKHMSFAERAIHFGERSTSW